MIPGIRICVGRVRGDMRVVAVSVRGWLGWEDLRKSGTPHTLRRESARYSEARVGRGRLLKTGKWTRREERGGGQQERGIEWEVEKEENIAG